MLTIKDYKTPKMFEMKALRPSVFIGSSTEGLRIAKYIQVLLDHTCEATIWSQGIFGLGEGTLESLVLAVEKFDFAILVLTPDDMTTSREKEVQSPRDNVLFELGLFVGGIGRERTFIVYDRDKEIKIPTDLAGITAATFREYKDGNLEAALGSCCTKIEERILRLNLKEESRLKGFSDATKEFEHANDKFNTLIKLMARSRKVELDVITKQFGPFINTTNLQQIQQDLDDLALTLND